MRRIKLILAVVAAAAMIVLGAAPAMADHLDDSGDHHDNFGVFDRDVVDEHVGAPRLIDGLVCFKVRERDISGDTIDRFWDCIDPNTGEEFEIP